jgi:hypothetical protein
MLLTAGLLVVVLALGVLALAPRLRLFDDRRARLAFLAVLAVVAVAVPVVAVAVVDRTADGREDDAATELFDWLSARSFSEASAASFGPAGGPPGVSAASIEDGVLVLQRPVVVAWQSRCVVGRYPPDGLPSVKRTSAPCP